MLAMGNAFYDTEAFHVQLSPNGPISGSPVFTSDTDDVKIIPDANGLGFTAYADVNVTAFEISITVPADNPNTPGQEELIDSVTGSFSHSMATNMGLSSEKVAKPVV